VGIDADTNAATFLTRATAVELPEMPKRRLADRILDEILTLRRPRSVVVEIEEHQDVQAAQERVLSESLPAGAGRRLIVEL
jgi:phosphopantothenoylcysteine decarboxylase/phosphopantothenate--cysteine ligase